MSENHIFPFQYLTDTDFRDFFSTENIAYDDDLIVRLSKKIFHQFSSETESYQEEIDPDQLIRRNMNIINPICNYLYPDEIENVSRDNNTPDQSLFKLLFANINSIVRKFEDLTEELNQAISNSFDILAFSESKLTDNINDLYSIPNYQFYTNSVSRDMGGVALHVHKIHKSSVRNDLSKISNHTETLFVEIAQQKRNILVGVVYRRPKTSIIDFMDSVKQILITIQNENKLCYITGDFNIDLLKADSSKQASDLIALFHSHFLFCTITKPTRVKKNSTTLIDHIWSNDLVNNHSNGIVLSYLSDHFPILSSFKTDKKPSTSNKTIIKRYRIYSEENINKFKEEINSTNWTFIYDDNDATTCFALLHNKLLEILKIINLK